MPLLITLKAGSRLRPGTTRLAVSNHDRATRVDSVEGKIREINSKKFTKLPRKQETQIVHDISVFFCVFFF